MYIKSAWSSLNKELLAMLSFLVISSIAALFYLVYTLLSLNALLTQGSRAVGTALVLQGLLVDSQNLQRSVRGYVITGDDSFLVSYNVSKEQIPAALKIIQAHRSIQINDVQAKRLTELSVQGLSAAEQSIIARRDFGFEAAQAQTLDGSSERLMEDLRKEITSISSYGLKNIGPMQQRSKGDLSRALTVAATLALLVFATCVAIIWYFRHAILHERSLESTKNEFLSLASHQLRTPATNVKQYIGLVLDGYMGDVSEEQRGALKIAYRNNESEIIIMNNLLDVAKLDLDRIQLHKKVTNVMKIIKQVVRDSKPHAKDQKQSVILNGPAQLMANVDPAYIKGITENLVDNAIKYAKEGSVTTVSVERDQDMFVIAVKDHGLGMRKKDHGKLFNKFTRLDNEFSAYSQGSGLGLYWVKKIVSLHGGTIDVSSKEGKGSTFTVRLPVR